MTYEIFNPIGNITVLVTSEITDNKRMQTIAQIFNEIPDCEQIGFIKILNQNNILLEMMGDELCGNAIISAAIYLAKLNLQENIFFVHVSYYNTPIKVVIERLEHQYKCIVELPMPNIHDNIIDFPGISHMIINANNISKIEMESHIIQLSNGHTAFGMIRYNENTLAIEPLVYVKNTNTLIWEHGCATGSIALGVYRYYHFNINESIINNPGGIITIQIKNNLVYLSEIIDI